VSCTGRGARRRTMSECVALLAGATSPFLCDAIGSRSTLLTNAGGSGAPLLQQDGWVVVFPTCAQSD
jgi:hypothetical protein